MCGWTEKGNNKVGVANIKYGLSLCEGQLDVLGFTLKIVVYVKIISNLKILKVGLECHPQGTQ